MATKPNNDFSDVTQAEMLDALKRSGYIFESEVVSMLIEKDYSVEPNVLYEGIVGGNKFEIDMKVVIYKDIEHKRMGHIVLTINLVFELKNYTSPFILFTPQDDILYSYANDEYIHKIRYKFRGSVYDALYKYITENKEYDKFTHFHQYCIFENKLNGNTKKYMLTASQDEKIHKAIQNLHQYCVEEVHKYSRDEERRIIIEYNIPVLLLRNKIYEYRNDEKLYEVDESRLLIRSAFNGEVKNSLMYICNQKNLLIMIERISTDFDKLLEVISKAKIKEEQ